MDDPIRAALERQAHAARQIRDHDGPAYDRHHARSGPIHTAWVAAGQPERVAGWSGPTPILYAPLKREGRIVPATPEQTTAWRAWVAAREQLRQETADG